MGTKVPRDETGEPTGQKCEGRGGGEAGLRDRDTKADTLQEARGEGGQSQGGVDGGGTRGEAGRKGPPCCRPSSGWRRPRPRPQGPARRGQPGAPAMA